MKEQNTTFEKHFIFGLLLTALPFILCILLEYTFAPLDSLFSLTTPFREMSATVSFPKTTFWHDTVSFFWPRMATFYRGEFPISYASNGGAPAFADSISGFFNPYAWIAFKLFKPTANQLSIFWLLNYVTLFSGMYFWLRSLRVQKMHALIAALTQSFTTSYLMGTYLSFQSLGPMSFVPWVFYFSETRKNNKEELTLVTLFLSLSILAGNFQTGVYPLLFFFLLTAYQKRIQFGILACFLAVLLTLPSWLASFEYHILMNNVPITARRSAMPFDTLGRIKALFAIPAIIFPELFGSTRSVDLFKPLKTSATYFISSIGFIAPLIIFSTPLSQWKKVFKEKTVLFSITLILVALILMVTPFLNVFYYRILCSITLALSVLTAFAFPHFELKRLSKNAFVTFLFLLTLAGLFFIFKATFYNQIEQTLITQLSTSTHGWWKEFQQERVHRFLTEYLFNFRFFLILISLLFLKTLGRLNLRRPVLESIVFALILIDLLSLNLSQLSINKVRSLEHPIYSLTAEKLKESNSYPLARFGIARCKSGAPLFEGTSHEFFDGVNHSTYYGSTQTPGVYELLSDFTCEENTKQITPTSLVDLRRSGISVLMVQGDYILNAPTFTKIYTGKEFTAWASTDRLWNEPVFDLNGTNKIFSKIVSFSSKKLVLDFTTTQTLERWSISLPIYRGWTYLLDGKKISEEKLPYRGMPIFIEKVKSGTHRLEATYCPKLFYIGFIGTLLALIAMIASFYNKRFMRLFL